MHGWGEVGLGSEKEDQEREYRLGGRLTESGEFSQKENLHCMCEVNESGLAGTRRGPATQLRTLVPSL